MSCLIWYVWKTYAYFNYRKPSHEPISKCTWYYRYPNSRVKNDDTHGHQMWYTHVDTRNNVTAINDDHQLLEAWHKQASTLKHQNLIIHTLAHSNTEFTYIGHPQGSDWSLIRRPSCHQWAIQKKNTSQTWAALKLRKEILCLVSMHSRALTSISRRINATE